MRIHFTDATRAKAAAKRLVRSSPALKLSAAQEVLARACGYRNWHEAVTVAGREPATVISLPIAQHLISELSAALGISIGDVQHAIRTLLTQRSAWTIDDQLALNASLLRSNIFGAPARGRPGTVVKVKAHGSVRSGYLQSLEDVAFVLYDTGPGLCADFEVVTPKQPLPDFIPSRLWLPYGFWTLRDGSQIAFARDYFPLWRVYDGVIERVDPWLWINDIEDEAHFSTIANTSSWSRGPARDLALKYLADHRISALPKLVDIMPDLIGPDVHNIKVGLRRFRARLKHVAPAPQYARLRFGEL